MAAVPPTLLSKMNSRYITKSELAIALVITKRTLTNYTKIGILPTPTHQGRDVGWTVDELQASLQAAPGNEVHLAEEKRQRLHRVLTEWASVNPVTPKHSSRISLTNHQLPEPVVVDDNYHHERDQRGACIEKVKRERAVLAIVHQEIRNTKSGSFEQHEHWKERNDVQERGAKTPPSGKNRKVSFTDLLPAQPEFTKFSAFCRPPRTAPIPTRTLIFP